MEGSPSSHSSTSAKKPVLRRRHSLRKTVDGWEEENTHPSSQRPSLSWDDHPYYAARLSDGNAVVDFYDDLSQRLYSSTDMTSDDPMTVIDESFFFLDYLASPSTSNSVPTASTSATSNYRVPFTTLLADCHDHRMSTIKEASPVSTERTFRLPSPAAAKGKGPELLLDPAVPAISSVVSNDAFHTLPTRPETMSNKKHQQSHPQQSNGKTNHIQKQRNGLQKLLDYIIPYPTRNFTSRKSSHNGKPRLRPGAPYRPPETHSDRTSLADDEDDGDGEWVLHGFFEISRS